MSFQISDYVITAIPNSPPHATTLIDLDGFLIRLVDGTLPGLPGHLRFRQVLAVFNQFERLVVYDNTAGHSLIFLPYNRARRVPRRLLQQAQQAINAQLGQFAPLGQALPLLQALEQVQVRGRALGVAQIGTVAWLSAVEAFAAATTTAAGATVYGGAAIMSNLATVGGLLGSGAVGGIVVVSAAPGMIVLKVVNAIEKDNEIKRINRVTGVAGTAVGLITVVECVASAGTAGLSASGITSGLCGVGSLLGTPTMVGGLFACGAITGGIAAAVVVPVWVAAKIHKERERVNQYHQFVSDFQILGYAGPP